MAPIHPAIAAVVFTVGGISSVVTYWVFRQMDAQKPVLEELTMGDFLPVAGPGGLPIPKVFKDNPILAKAAFPILGQQLVPEGAVQQGG
jgi:hypothetical protein